MVLRRSSSEKNTNKKAVKVKKQSKVRRFKEKKTSYSSQKEKRGVNPKIENPEIVKLESKSNRPKDEVVIYPESDFESREISPQDSRVLIGPQTLTRFERARIVGSRSLQLSLGAPTLVDSSNRFYNTISIAVAELNAKVLPISIRRILPNALYQDIPIDWLKQLI